MDASKAECFIGKSYNSEEVKEFLSPLTGLEIKDEFADMQIRDYPPQGLSIYLDASCRVIAMFFNGTRDEERSEFKGILPLQINFKSSKEEIIAKLGIPSVDGVEKSTGLPWVRYDFESFFLHLQYSPDLKTITMATLMQPSFAKGEF